MRRSDYLMLSDTFRRNQQFIRLMSSHSEPLTDKEKGYASAVLAIADALSRTTRSFDRDRFLYDSGVRKP